MKTKRTKNIGRLLVAAALVIFITAITGCSSRRSADSRVYQQQQPPVQRIEITHRYKPNINDTFAQINEQQRQHWTDIEENSKKREAERNAALDGITRHMKTMPDIKILQGPGASRTESDDKWKW